MPKTDNTIINLIILFSNVIDGSINPMWFITAFPLYKKNNYA